MNSRYTVVALGLLAAVLVAGGPSAESHQSGNPCVLVFGSDRDGAVSYFAQSFGATREPTRLPIPDGAENVRLSDDGAVAAMTTRGGPTDALRLVSLHSGAGEHVLAHEWVWDFALRPDGGAIAFVAGHFPRKLHVAGAPRWRSQPVALEGGEPSGPCWLEGNTLLFVRGTDRDELVRLDVSNGATQVLLRVRGSLSELTFAGSEIWVVHSHPAMQPGRLLRLAVDGGEPGVVARGFFVPGTLAIAPGGKFVGVATSADANAVLQRKASFQWFGGVPEAMPLEIPGVVSAKWSPDGRRLALGRQSPGRRWIEIFTPGLTGFEPAGFKHAPCFPLQWLRTASGLFPHP